jgi:uncharacterized protein (DUF488 family)
MATRAKITTVGHGTATADAFAELVRRAGVDTVVDVRRFPGSRRHPHFAKDEMARWLDEHDLRYRWLEALGGRRGSGADSPNVALRNQQFRAYADHMAGDEFALGVGELLEAATKTAVAVMCSESVWWRCHRRLLADHLVLVAGVAVEHVFHDGRRTPHPVTPGARRAGGHVVYDVLT